MIENVRNNIVSKKVYRKVAYFTIGWSDMYSCERGKIYGLVPSLSGIWEIYWLEKSLQPRFLKMGLAWYGGLRNELRFESDASERSNSAVKEYLESGDCYFRYVICEDRNDVYEVYTVLRSIRGPDALRGEETSRGAGSLGTVQGAGGLGAQEIASRYEDVRISEPDEMRIHRVRRSKEPPIREQSRRVPDMFDVAEELKRLQRKQNS